MAIFNELNFNVSEKIFFEVFKNPDKGFGFSAQLDKELLTDIQVETMEFLLRCQKKDLLGSVHINFKTDAVGEINELQRHVEKISFKDGKYIIEAFY